MKVKCIGNIGRDLPVELLDLKSGRTETSDYPLTIGKVYVVYGLTIHVGFAWYYICDDDYTYFPVWNPSPLFEIVDPRLSKYWEFSYSRNGRCESESSIIIAYPEWAQDPQYYWRLSENHEPEVEVFKRYRRLIDKENSD